jgi:hypothetical protein
MDLLREDFFRTKSFFGVAPLLQTIQQRMTVTSKEKVNQNGQEMTKLTAVWSEVPPPGSQWQAYIPRECRLFLGRAGSNHILWPYRLEWWGPAPPRAGDSMLFAMEFRNPKIDQSLPADRLAQEFKFDPGKNQVMDNTKDMAEFYKMRVQQIAAQKQQAQTAPAAAPVQPKEPSKDASKDVPK